MPTLFVLSGVLGGLAVLCALVSLLCLAKILTGLERRLTLCEERLAEVYGLLDRLGHHWQGAPVPPNGDHPLV
jgi:hypothetical protein